MAPGGVIRPLQRELIAPFDGTLAHPGTDAMRAYGKEETGVFSNFGGVWTAPDRAPRA